MPARPRPGFRPGWDRPFPDGTRLGVGGSAYRGWVDEGSLLGTDIDQDLLDEFDQAGAEHAILTGHLRLEKIA